MRLRTLLALVPLALLLAGCGGGGDKTSATGDSGSASIAPASAELFVSLLTDFEHEQWQTLQRLADRFPSLQTALEDPEFVDARDAFGPDTGIVALTLDDSQEQQFVGVNKPRDEARFRSLLAQSDTPDVAEKIEGWLAFANTQATLDRFKAALDGGSLADDEQFQEAFAALPESRLFGLYIPGEPIAKAYRESLDAGEADVPGVGRLTWFAASALVRDEGFAVDLRAKGDDVQATSFTPTLLDEVPAGALAVLSVKGLDAALDDAKQNPALERRLGQGAEFLGDTLDKVIALFENEAVVYARPATPAPEVTVALAVDDEQGALAVVDELLGKLAGVVQQSQVDVDGISARRIVSGTTTLFVAAFDGKLVVTSSDTGIRGLRDDGATLTDDPLYTEAVEAAELPEQTAGSLYVNLQALLPFLNALGGGQPGQREALEAAEEIGAFVAYGDTEGDILSARLFLALK